MVYINKAKYGECEWTVLEHVARKEVFLREPPPVLPEFNAWFQNKFPNVKNNFVKYLVYRVIVDSSRNKETPLSYVHLKELFHLAGETELTVKNIIDELSAAFGVAYSSYSHLLAYARNIEIDMNLALELQKEWNSFSVKKSHPRYSECISPITGELVSSPTYEKVIKESKECIKKHSDKKQSKMNYLSEIVSYLNGRKMPQVLIEKMDQLIESKDQLTENPSTYNRLLACRNNLIGGVLWEAKEQGYRIFPIGESLSTINKEDRWQVTKQEDGFYEVDLKNAHFSIMAFMIGAKEMIKLVNNGSIWPQLLIYLNLDSSFKDSLKECIYSILYGSGEDMQKILLIQDQKVRLELKTAKENLGKKLKIAKTKEEKNYINSICTVLSKRIELESSAQDKEIYKNLVAHPAIKELLEGSKKFIKDIKNKGFFRDGCNVYYDNKDVKSDGKITNIIMTSYEKRLLMPIYKDAFKTKKFEVIMDQHDGVTLYFDKSKISQEVIEKVLAGLTNKVNQEAKKIGIETGLSTK